MLEARIAHAAAAAQAAAQADHHEAQSAAPDSAPSLVPAAFDSGVQQPSLHMAVPLVPPPPPPAQSVVVKVEQPAPLAFRPSSGDSAPYHVFVLPSRAAGGGGGGVGGGGSSSVLSAMASANVARAAEAGRSARARSIAEFRELRRAHGVAARSLRASRLEVGRVEGAARAGRLPARPPVPGRRKGGLDAVAEEALWMAADFGHERVWKRTAAGALAREAAAVASRGVDRPGGSVAAPVDVAVAGARAVASLVRAHFRRLTRDVRVRGPAPLFALRRPPQSVPPSSSAAARFHRLLVASMAHVGGGSDSVDGAVARAVDATANVFGPNQPSHQAEGAPVHAACDGPTAIARAEREAFDGASRTALPVVSRAHARPYQAAGARWLSAMRARGAPAVLADARGLGKRFTVAVHLAVTRGVSLLVAPSCTVVQWVAELRRWAPSLSVCGAEGPRTPCPWGCVCITTPDALSSVAHVIWDTLVVDATIAADVPPGARVGAPEWGYVHDRDVAAALEPRQGAALPWATLAGLSATHRIVVANRLLPLEVPLLSQLAMFLLPGVLPTYEAAAAWAEATTAGAAAARMGAKLRNALLPFVLRRSIGDVGIPAQLPARRVGAIRVEPTVLQLSGARALLSGKRLASALNAAISETDVRFLVEIIAALHAVAQSARLSVTAPASYDTPLPLEPLEVMHPCLLAGGCAQSPLLSFGMRGIATAQRAAWSWSWQPREAKGGGGGISRARNAARCWDSRVVYSGRVLRRLHGLFECRVTGVHDRRLPRLGGSCSYAPLGAVRMRVAVATALRAELFYVRPQVRADPAPEVPCSSGEIDYMSGELVEVSAVPWRASRSSVLCASAKLRVLDQLSRDARRAGGRVLVVTAVSYTATMVCEGLSALGTRHLRLDAPVEGAGHGVTCAMRVDRFNADPRIEVGVLALASWSSVAPVELSSAPSAHEDAEAAPAVADGDATMMSPSAAVAPAAAAVSSGPVSGSRGAPGCAVLGMPAVAAGDRIGGPCNSGDAAACGLNVCAADVVVLFDVELDAGAAEHRRRVVERLQVAHATTVVQLIAGGTIEAALASACATRSPVQPVPKHVIEDGGRPIGVEEVRWRVHLVLLHGSVRAL